MIPSKDLLQSIEEMLLEVEPYLLSPELYWPLSPRSRANPQGRLTLGNLLLALDQLYALEESLETNEAVRFQNAIQAWDRANFKWKSAIMNKASLEATSRLRIWRAYLEDLEEGQGSQFNYQHEVRNRVIVERLFDLDVDQTQFETDLRATDRLLKSLTTPSDFLWPASLQTQYGPEQFWYLYRTPRKAE